MSELLKCSKCGQYKPPEAFQLKNSSKRGRHCYCKQCYKEYRAAKKPFLKKQMHKWYSDNKDHQAAYMKFYNYGITPEEYNDLFTKQNGRCAICGRHQNEFKTKLAIDHNHSTGRVRGLLCASCNRGIGYLQDSPELLLVAAKYLSSQQ